MKSPGSKFFKRKHSKLLFFFSIALGLFFVLVFVTQQLINRSSPWVKAKIISAVKEQSDSLYSIEFGDINLSLYNSAIYAENIVITTDTLAWEDHVNTVQKKKPLL